MSTILFSEIVFGPIHSRRLGTSLGVNLLPYDGKLCTFDCIYCECGLNKDFRTRTKLPDRENVFNAIKDKLISLKKEGVEIDVITFAGNGEPTLHPDFCEIIEDAIVLRDVYYPKSKISVLSNGMHLDKQKVLKALKKTDNPILKLDSGIDETIKIIDRPNSPSYSVSRQVKLFKQLGENFILQTMFLKGEFEGYKIDNTTEEEISTWLEIVSDLRPREVMIYTIDRETAVKGLEKIPVDKLKQIAERVGLLGIKTNVAG